ncbi:hypothetical protein JNM05_01190 [bacterium]|nr:hypothetical protein [bacterium]
MKINTKFLMSASALFMGLSGLSVSFFPQEIMRSAGVEPAVLPILVLQILGALLLAFAMVNWMAKDILIGGIYSRPVAVGNFMHFMVGALALIKGVLRNSDLSFLWVAALIYSALAVAFGMVIFMRPPIQEKK